MKSTIVILLLVAVCLAVSTEHVEENNAADQLVREVQRMENAVRDEQRAHADLWNSQSADCVNEIGFRSQEVADALVALTNSNSAQGKCENALAASEADKAKAEAYVQAINGIVENLDVQRQTENAVFNHVVNEELNPAIEAVNGVFPILEEFSQGPSSLIQLTNHLNKSFIQMVKAKKSTQFGAVFVQLLAAQAVGVSEETIEQLSKLFDDLLEDLTNEKEHLIQVENDAQAAYDVAIAAYNAILNSLSSTIASLEAYIVDLNTCVQTEKGVSASAEAKRSRNQDALEHAVEMCDAFEIEFNNSSAARDQELSLLGKLKSFVREQEEVFGNYGVDGVNAFDEYQKSFAETRAHARANFLQVSLKKYNSSNKVASVPSKCESCRKSFLQKKLGF